MDVMNRCFFSQRLRLTHFSSTVFDAWVKTNFGRISAHNWTHVPNDLYLTAYFCSLLVVLI
jgi:hypothetical protein